MNRATICGRLGRDPEIRHTQGGAAVANFSIATSERYTGKDGTRQETTEWHRCVAFGKLAEICEKYLQKGKQVLLEGRIQTRTWEDKSGNKKSATEIVVNNLELLGGKDRQDDPQPQDEAPAMNRDDIPF